MTLISKESVIGIVQKHGDEIDDELYHAMMGEIRELPVHKKITEQVWSYGIGDPEITRCPFCGFVVIRKGLDMPIGKETESGRESLCGGQRGQDGQVEGLPGQDED